MKNLVLMAMVPILLAFKRPDLPMKTHFTNSDWSALKSYLIRKSKSEKELDRNLLQIRGLERDYETCRVQLKLRTLPVKCYEILKSEKNWGWITRAREKELLGVFDQVCLDSVAEISQLSDPRLGALKKGALSIKCRTNLAKKLEIIKYKSSEIRPDDLFEARFQ